MGIGYRRKLRECPKKKRIDGMRKKEDKILVTFYTTAEAMATEKACREAGLEGRLIPVPREVSAGCGFVWCASPEYREKTEEVLKEKEIEYEEILRMMV